MPERLLRRSVATTASLTPPTTMRNTQIQEFSMSFFVDVLRVFDDGSVLKTEIQSFLSKSSLLILLINPHIHQSERNIKNQAGFMSREPRSHDSGGMLPSGANGCGEDWKDSCAGKEGLAALGEGISSPRHR